MSAAWILATFVCGFFMVRMALAWIWPVVPSVADEKRVGSDEVTPSLKGPFNMPWMGYLPFITEMPHLKFKLLSEKYGPVFR